jgi:acetyltransferase
MENNTEAVIRPICPEDESMMVQFHGKLSADSVYLRYFHMMNLGSRVSHERLERICFVDHSRETVLVAERDQEILAVGRLVKEHDPNQGEFAILVADPFQGHGLGTDLLRRLIEIAREEKLDRITADILPENDHMIHVCRHFGFDLRHSLEEHLVKAELSLRRSS